MGDRMNRFSLYAALIVGAISAPALSQGQIGTVERGAYICELPGDAAGAVGVEQPEESFVIESASRYSSPQGSGTYLRRDNQIIMTSGPRNGTAYQMIARGFLRKIVDGQPGRLRCVRQGE
ncbi:hypothetical protein D2V07_01620 [Aurantiacibacter zhengii]|uniref:Elongation factor P n=2 Tax=Aurantiacibacter zhengii TaxID=2307003 RepID=A0A418NWH3_9SPHN|nr:hypothetical protein D2V07_01620 [Aurantiacibacter zhengii]